MSGGCEKGFTHQGAGPAGPFRSSVAIEMVGSACVQGVDIGCTDAAGCQRVVVNFRRGRSTGGQSVSGIRRTLNLRIPCEIVKLQVM